MANIDTNSGGKQGKAKQKKINLRVDFTPMVDMNMLLITFFMFCTTLSKPQTMDISMPDKKNMTDIKDMPKVKPELALTIILADENRVFYYEGEPNYEDYASLKETNYTADGLRKLLLRRNANIVQRINELKEKKKNNQVTEDQFTEQAAEIKRAKDALVVMIKPMDTSTYENMVDALDEMLICNVGKYTVVDFSDVEDFLMKNLQTKGHAAKNSN